MVVFKSYVEDGTTEEGEVAVLVTEYQSLSHGIWLGVSVLGAEQEHPKKE